MDKLKIIVISGLPGVGKSTLAEKVAKKLKFPIFSVDPIESSILKSGIKRSFKTGLAAYIIAKTLAEENLNSQMSVIIDAVSPVKESRKMWQELSERYGAKLVIIECVLNEKIHRERIEKRVRNLHGIAEVTWEDVLERKKEYLKWNQERLIIDTKNTNEENLSKAIEYIFNK